MEEPNQPAPNEPASGGPRRFGIDISVGQVSIRVSLPIAVVVALVSFGLGAGLVPLLH